MKIKVKCKEDYCFPFFYEKGDWFDLWSSEDVEISGSRNVQLTEKENEFGVITRTLKEEVPVYYIPLGIAMELPKGFEAIVAPRSSTPSKLGVMCANSIGVIDNSYNGDNDEWKFPVIPLRETEIPKGIRVCQFRIQLSQKATVWQKIKWLFCKKIEFVRVDTLGNCNRGGIGSTGSK